MTLWRYASIGLLATAVVWLPAMLVAANRVYILGIPDAKFGADGLVLFVAFVWGIAAVATGAVSLVVYAMRATKQPFSVSLGATALGSAAMSAASVALPQVPPFMQFVFGEIGGMVVSWALASAAALTIAHIVLSRRRNPTSGSSRPASLRSAGR